MAKKSSSQAKASPKPKTDTAKVKIKASRIPEDFPIAGIGASAGGLDALVSLFKAMPAKTGIAFVVVVHLDPTHSSLMPELLQKTTEMPVHQIEDGMTVEPDRVYVVPPNRELSILHGTLQLLELPDPRGAILPIDAFFRSLALDQGNNAIGIVLSGTGTDGTLGIKAIKGELGMVMVQDEESAKYPGMPNSAKTTGLVDFVLSPAQMPAQLIRYTQHANQNTKPPVEPCSREMSQELQKIFIILRAKTNHDFSLYKKNTISRRVERRMNLHQIDDISVYVKYLKDSDREADILFKELLIGVTSFFRDPPAFDVLEKKLIPELLATKPDGQTFRVWAPGCSTGEEPYSIAIMLHECMERLDRHFHVQIFATDLDESSIVAARTGRFPASIAGDVGPDRIDRYFIRGDDKNFQIKKSIREMLVFATQNVIKDPPFTKLDLLCCRNLLIYLNAELQQKLLPVFHYSLNKDGILFLGSSETVGAATGEFATLDKKWKIYRRKSSAAMTPPIMSQPSDQSHFEARDPVTSGTVERAEALSALQIAESILQQSGLPPCAIVNDSFNTVYIHGKTGRYLEPSEGRASLNIVEMARPGLKTDLAVALRQVVTSQQAVTRRNIRIDGDQGDVVVNLSVKPILDHTSVPGLIMVVFEDAAKAGKPQKSRAPESRENKKPKRVADLEQALLHSNESLQTIVEELETSNEELRSTNEELQSTNEELQSTNEELETSKEELQSLNEESVVINAELQARIDELTHSNDDLKNLLDSAEIATVFLDTELKIRRYTAPTLDIIPLEATDVGRPLKHLATELVDVDLAEQSELVLDDLAVREFLAHTKDHRHFLIRLRPYRTTTNVIAGVVITLEDVTKRQRTAEALQQSEKRLRTLFELSNDSILLIDAQTERIQECNHAAFERLGYSRDEFLSLTVPTLETPESPDTISTHIAKIVESGEDEFESKLKSKDGTTHEVLIKAKVISIGERNFVMATISDLSTG